MGNSLLIISYGLATHFTIPWSFKPRILTKILLNSDDVDVLAVTYGVRNLVDFCLLLLTSAS